MLVPVGFAAALLERREWPSSPGLPLRPGGDSAADARIDDSVFRTNADGLSFAVVRDGAELVVAVRGELAPAVLAYWTTTAGPLDALPEDAMLLGPVTAAARRFPAPDGQGQVVLYSIGHGAVLAHATPERN